MHRSPETKLTKEDMQMSDKQMIKHTSCHQGNETTMRYHYTPITKVKFATLTTPGEDVDQQEPSFTPGKECKVV